MPLKEIKRTELLEVLELYQDTTAVVEQVKLIEAPLLEQAHTEVALPQGQEVGIQQG